MIQDRHPVEWVQRQVGRAAQFGFEIMKIERDLLMRQDEPDDVDKGADRKTVNSNVGHDEITPGLRYIGIQDAVGAASSA